MPSGRFCKCGHYVDDHDRGNGMCRVPNSKGGTLCACIKFNALKPYPLEEIDPNQEDLPALFQHMTTKLVITLSCNHKIKHNGEGFDSNSVWLGQPVACDACDKVSYVKNIFRLKQYKSQDPTSFDSINYKFPPDR